MNLGTLLYLSSLHDAIGKRRKNADRSALHIKKLYIYIRICISVLFHTKVKDLITDVIQLVGRASHREAHITVAQ